jgi:colanic acid/amylovoran biosynthesis glycosyltransferase
MASATTALPMGSVEQTLIERHRILSTEAGPAPRIGYLINQYPAVSHTFIRREILALEALGHAIERVALRRGQGIVDPVDQAEEKRTFYLLDSKSQLLVKALRVAVTRPGGFVRAIGLMMQMAWRSDRGIVKHLIYLLEAAALAGHAKARNIGHLHAHFGTNSAEVAMLAAAIGGFAYSFTVHGCEEYDKPEALGLRLKMRQARFVAAVSHFGRAQLLRWCADGDEAKIHLIRCGLDVDSIAQEPMPDPAPIRFVTVARLCRLKGHQTLLEALVELNRRGRRAELVFVGDGETRAAIEETIRKYRLSDQVRITGWRDNAAVMQEIAASRALIVSSYAENLPVVIMEAMALGRPVIASVLAGIPELVRPAKTGWLVPAGSAEALADAMQECLEAPPATLQAFANQGSAAVRNQHDVRVEAAKLAALFSAEQPSPLPFGALQTQPA